MSRTQIEFATQNLQFARQYTLLFLADLTPDDWFRQPSGGVTHLAWQVGHLAMAEYALTMLRIRGKESSDRDLISNDFFRRFQKGTQPEPAPGNYPPPTEIVDVLTRVHQRALQELAGYTDAELMKKLPAPYAVHDNMLGSILFCSAHEMLHAGQIGLIRRLLGKSPLR